MTSAVSKSLPQEYKSPVAALDSFNKINSVAKPILIGLTILFAACAVVSLVTWLVVPLSLKLGVSLLASSLLATLVSGAIVFCISKNYDQDHYNDLFNNLVIANKSILDNPKFNLLKQYGVKCTSLSIPYEPVNEAPAVEFGVEVGAFISWVHGEYKSQDFSEGRKIYKTLPRIFQPVAKHMSELRGHKDLLKLHESLKNHYVQMNSKNLSSVTNGFVTGKNLETKNTLWGYNQIKRLISCCPNLKGIVSLNLLFEYAITEAGEQLHRPVVDKLELLQKEERSNAILLTRSGNLRYYDAEANMNDWPSGFTHDNYLISSIMVDE